jgi:hypothetical protein
MISKNIMYSCLFTDATITKCIGSGVGLASLITENLLSHPFVVLRRQCQVGVLSHISWVSVASIGENSFISYFMRLRSIRFMYLYEGY